MVMKSIFKLIDKRTNNVIYIGYSSMALSTTLANLKYNFKNNKGCKKYKSIFESVGIDNILIKLVESFEFDNIDEVNKKVDEIKESFNLFDYRLDILSSKSQSSNIKPKNWDNLLKQINNI